MSLTLRDKIRETSDRLIVDRLNGIRKPVGNTFTREELTFDYSKIPQKYHASRYPDDMITLYKGALKGFEKVGFLANAYSEGIPEHVIEAKEIIESGSEKSIYELFDNHTWYYLYTALLSATFNPEVAQVHAPTYSIFREIDKTIYQLSIRANRCVVDCHDTGNCGNGKELFILGVIFPDEIKAVKILNDDEHSELIENDHGIHIIRIYSDKKSHNRDVKDPANWRTI